MIFEIAAGVIIFLSGAVVGRRRAVKTLAFENEKQLLLENPEGPTTGADFEKLLEAAGFRVGTLTDYYSESGLVTGCFRKSKSLKIGIKVFHQVSVGMQGWRIAYLVSEDCKYCNVKPFYRKQTLYRLGECSGRSERETCLVCWRCGWILDDNVQPEQNALGEILRGHTNIYPVLEEMAFKQTAFTVRSRLSRVERERNELAALAVALDEEKARLIALQRDHTSVEKPVIQPAEPIAEEPLPVPGALAYPNR
jgi:hypothetical protein